MNKFSDHVNYNCQVTLSDGSEYKVFANWMHNEGLDKWEGWKCGVGSTRLFIDHALNVYSGECMNDHLGTAGDFVTKEDSICKYAQCRGCTDDLITSKSKN